MSDEKKNIIFYDSECGLCNSFVIWIIKKDKNNVFYFSPLNGKYFNEFVKTKYTLNFTPNSVVYYDGSKIDQGYEAFVEIITKLFSLPIFIKKFLKLMLLTKIGNRIYKWIAKNRYKFVKPKCLVISRDEYESKFLF